MTTSFEIQLEPDDYKIDEKGNVTFMFDPDDYDLIDVDDAEDYIDEDDFLDKMEAEELLDALERQGIAFRMDDSKNEARDIVSTGTPDQIRRFFADMLNISRLATADDICNQIKTLI